MFKRENATNIQDEKLMRLHGDHGSLVQQLHRRFLFVQDGTSRNLIDFSDSSHISLNSHLCFSEPRFEYTMEFLVHVLDLHG